MNGENTMNMSEGNEKLIECMEFIRDTEAAKPIDEMDVDLVNECVAFILELKENDIKLSPEEIQERVSKIPFKKTESEAEIKTETTEHIRFNKRRVLFIAATLAALIALLCIASTASQRSIFDMLKERFGTVEQTPPEVRLDVEGQTVIVGTDGCDYETAEEFVEKEHKSVLIPAMLPDDLEIQFLHYVQTEGKEIVSLVFTDSRLTSEVVFNSKIPDKNIYSWENITINDLNCYFGVMEDVSTVQVYFEYNNDTYLFAYNDKQVLIDIIENLELYR